MTRKRGKDEVTREIGRHYGRVDLDRVGFFDDQPNGPFDKYTKTAPAARSDFKGRQLLAGQTNDFFDKTFKRIFDGEALPARAKKEPSGGRVMLPPSPSKLHSTPNDWFGCIGKSPGYFSPEVKNGAAKKGKQTSGESPNFKIKPGPLGGPGYLDICLNPYPKYSSEPYDYQEKKGGKFASSSPKGKFLTSSAPIQYFTPNPYFEAKPGPTYERPASDDKFETLKSGYFYVPFPKEPGGHHAGCFSKFPEYMSQPDPKRKGKSTVTSDPKFVGGGPSSRSKYTNSIISQVTRISCNAKNYREYSERVYPLSY